LAPLTLASLLAKARPSDGCLIWQGALNSDGYPVVRDGAKLKLAHRLVCALAHGALEAGQVVDQVCGRPACIKPSHLEAKTQQKNIERAGSIGMMDRD
jgi:hypothetical protein